MPRLLLASALLLLLLPARADAGQTVTIKLAERRAGSARMTTERLQMEMDIDAVVDGQRIGIVDASRTETTRTREELLVESPQHRRILVDYLEKRRQEQTRGPQGEETTDEPDPVQGRSYVVDWSQEAGVRVEYADGTSPPEGEISVVTEGFSDMEEPHSRIARVLAGRRLEVGAPVDLPKEAMAELVGAADEFDIRAVDLSLARKARVGGQPCAVFDVRIVLGRSEDQMELVVEVAGDFAIRLKDGQVASYELRGPMTISGEGGEPGGPSMTLAGSGTLEAVATMQDAK